MIEERIRTNRMTTSMISHRPKCKLRFHFIVNLKFRIILRSGTVEEEMSDQKCYVEE